MLMPILATDIISRALMVRYDELFNALLRSFYRHRQHSNIDTITA